MGTVLREVKLLENGNIQMQKHCARCIKQWEMTPTSTVPETNSGASIKITTLPFTEEQSRKRVKMGQKPQSKKVPAMWKMNSTCTDQNLEAYVTLSRDQSTSPVTVNCVSEPSIHTCPVSTSLYTNKQVQPKNIKYLGYKIQTKTQPNNKETAHKTTYKELCSHK